MQLLLNINREDSVKMTNTVCECCWKPIEHEVFTVDDITMCEDCFIYHVGDYGLCIDMS